MLFRSAAYVRAATGSGGLAALTGLAVAMVGVISAAAVLNGGVGYLRSLVDVPSEILAIIIVLLLGAAAIIGVLESLAFAAVLTLIEVVGDRKSTRLNSSHAKRSRMPSSA